MLALVGTLVVSTVPNLFNAIQRTKQRRTMADMRTLGAAMEAYAVDNQSYPTASCMPNIFVPPPKALKPDSFRSLIPTYISRVPTLDGWNREFGFTRDANGSFYVIQSRGAAGGGFSTLFCGETDDINANIAFSNGAFIQWPRGGLGGGTDGGNSDSKLSY